MTDLETIDTPTSVHDVEAERTVLAACLNDPAMIGRARRTLTVDAFWHAHHGLIFAAMLALDDAQKPVGPFPVYEHLVAEKLLERAGGANYLHELYAYPFFGAGPAVSRVVKLGRQRARAAVALRFSQIAAEVDDPDRAAEAWARAAVELEVLIDDHDDGEPVPGLASWEEFLARPPRPSDAVIPGLLDRQEVVMILAAPGVGKSWLSRQVALTVAAGTHPFHAGKQIPPMRTLLIDLENPESTVQRQTAAPYASVQLLSGSGVGDRGFVWLYPAGLNIRKRADAALLERVVDETNPDLVCIGSLYNLFSRGSSDYDTAAEETIAVLNKVRARQRCALWIEHHMPKAGEGGHRHSPFGSSLWERWPSYGRVISRIGGEFYDFTVFRGDREAGREFPAGLQRGGKLPWSPVWDHEELDLIKENFS
jgi:replicative DNA helicase